MEPLDKFDDNKSNLMVFEKNATRAEFFRWCAVHNFDVRVNFQVIYLPPQEIDSDVQ
jgi:hypothetical protein